jgi:cysteine desulfurase/selenocysteine lyase
MLNSAAIRADFPALANTVHGRPLVYLDNAATAHKPRPVLERLVAFYTTTNGNVHRGVHYLSERASADYEAARETVRRFLNAREAREVVFTHGTTDALNLLAGCFEELLHSGDEMVVTEMEHHSNLVPWQLLCARRGATLKYLPFDDDGLLQIEALPALLTNRTRLVAVSHVSNVLGIVNPVAELIAAAHDHHVPVLVDAAQSAPHRSLDVQTMDCDFLVFSGHKLYAATGIGVLYGKHEWLQRLAPSRYGGGMIDTVNRHNTTFADPPHKFEAGTPNVAAALSLASAIDYITQLDFAEIQAHEQELLRCALERLAALDGIRIYGTAEPKCGVLSFNLEGIDPYDAALILDKLGIAVRSGSHCAETVMQHYGVGGMLRASFALYNTLEEVDHLVEGLRRARALLA